MHKRQVFAIAVIMMYMSIPVYAELNGYRIAEKAYNIEDGNDFESVMTMKIIKANGPEKRRDLKFYRKDFGDDNRSLIIFQSPADIRGTSFLTWNFKSKENDQWLYLPALKQVSRIAAANRSKSFMGSDYSYEDLSRRSPQKDDFTLTGEEAIGADPCYVVEATAKDRNEKFTRRLCWVRKDNFIVMRVDFFDASNAPVKRFSVLNLKQVRNIWTVLNGKMENLRTKGHTTLELSNVRYNTGLADRLFKKEGMVQ